jgi:hypothetical protein
MTFPANYRSMRSAIIAKVFDAASIPSYVGFISEAVFYQCAFKQVRKNTARQASSATHPKA